MADDLEERLSNLLAVTDVRLTRLDVDDMLVEVLERVRAILEADTAAVLLAEPGSTDLVARAACGLEEEVRQGVRVPIGTGFAGTIAARRQPVVLERVDSTTVANPILWEKGIRRMLGVPLQVGDTLLGVLHVGRLDDISFDAHDAELLLVAAERVAAAIQVRRSAIESAAAAVLERELLPTRLPTLPGLRFAARYAPAEDRSVGGDWYDVFVLPSGELWVVIGDVAGHGLNSAVIVSRVKSALRSYSLIGGGPARVLELTHRKLRHFEVDKMVTVLCAVALPPYDHFEIASAGHPPPLLLTDRPGEFVALATGPPLGGLRQVSYESVGVDLPPGGTILFYTDGLVERRGESMDVGLARLRGAIDARDPEIVCRDVMLRLVGDIPTVDDVALLAMRRTRDVSDVSDDADEGLRSAGLADDVAIGELRLGGTSASVARARAFALRAAVDTDPEVRAVIELLVSELATNCIVHASSDFTVRIFRSGTRIRVECTDDGGGAVTLRHAAPTDTHGRGLHFVAQLADDWGVHAAETGSGKTVWFIVELPTAPEKRSGFALGHAEGALHV
jgi:phosphoserine phosphatase RsbU/P